MEDNNNGSQVEKSIQKKKKHKKKTKNIAEIYQKHETIIISRESTEYLPLALEDFDQVNILRDNSSFWICLEALEKQKGDMPPLPQISEKYIRIEDGSLPVSYMQNYITKKLNLKNDDEVEITCLGHQISTKMELKKLAKLWFNMSFKGKSKTKPSPNDYITIIGYGRGVSQS
ncbi:E3 ubiquitin protein ligase DRIP2-like [Arachis duranensis]|uniref:E3 ubiquitin protein ligase DRIP2-like n=1 Tax=Arachis duranensis TaxID=130453 RepID=A0A9C6TIM9_ARADU|nr:E3 ubiquitin protein ligase DRIP2-like [Arachis duranensis]